MTGNTNVIGNPIITHVQVTASDDDERQDEGRVAIPLSGEDALHGLLQVDPQSEPVDDR